MLWVSITQIQVCALKMSTSGSQTGLESLEFEDVAELASLQFEDVPLSSLFPREQDIFAQCQQGDENCRVFALLRALPVETLAIVELDLEHARYHSRLAVAKLTSFASLMFALGVGVWMIEFVLKS
jgi:hypothetical protein